MKRILLLSVIILVFSLLEILNVAALTYELVVETTFTDPYPVEPGNNLVLSLSLFNNGSLDATNVVIELEPIEPFTLIESSKKEVGSIKIRKTRIVDYDLYVDSSAVSALYEIPVRITYGVDKGFVRTVLVRVQGEPKFELLDVVSGIISPGDQGNITVELQNVGTGKARRTSVTFTSTSDYVDPVLSGGVAYLGDVGPSESKQTEFTILADSDSEYGVYSGKINVTYDDESGNELTEVFDVGILVSGEPELQVHKTEVDKEENELTIEIVNIGNAEAKAIAAKLIINGKIFDVDYVTSIKIDKRSTLKFALPNSMRGELELSYKGPDNEPYSQTEDVAWVVPFTFPTWIAVIIVLVIAYFVWKKKLWKKIKI